MEKRLISTGKDYTEMLPIFRNLVLKSGVQKGDALMWAGCPGTVIRHGHLFQLERRSALKVSAVHKDFRILS